MTEVRAIPRQRRLLELGLLAVALIVAIGVGAYLLFGADGDDEVSEPADVVQELYDAAGDDDSSAYGELLDPAIRDSLARDVVLFGSSVGAFSIEEQEADVRDLEVRETNRQAGWATVSARGSVSIDEGAAQDFNETLYLRQAGETWLVSTQAEFVNAFSTPSAGPTAAEGLGVLVPQRPKVGELAPDFALIDARDGATVRKLSDYRGKAVVVNFYASWCEPCKTEIPAFQEAFAAKGEELVFLGVDFGESQEKAVSILEEYGGTYPAMLDSDQSVGQHYRVAGLPVTFFVDAEGILRATVIGEVKEKVLSEALAKVGVTYTAPE